MFVQIVKLKLKPDSSRELFIQLTEQMVAYLKSRDGFVAYELYEGVECWSDRIVWLEKSYAEKGLKEFSTTELARQVMSFVEEDFISFFGRAVVTA
jgi:quinol monooxygenase YgiN